MSTASLAKNESTATPRLAVIIAIIAVIAGLGILDKFLAQAQNVEVQRLAKRSYMDGLRLRRNGHTSQAVDAFRKAHAFERRNREYGLELADSLIASNKLDEAERLLADILEREPNDGRANLLNAHLMIRRGMIGQAESYFHRAIYGEWPSDAAAHRVAVRMELIDFLAAKPEHEDLLAELISLPEQKMKDPASLQHLAQLFLVAGSPSRAVDEYRTVIRNSPRDGAAYAGLGDAELQLGDYSKARDAFLTASIRKPDDPEIRRKLDLSSTLAALDPTYRKLTSMEKYRRSLTILGLAHSSLEACLAKHPTGASDETQQLLSTANQVLTGRSSTGIANENAENALGMAEKAWQERVRICGVSVSAEEEPLRLIVERLAR